MSGSTQIEFSIPPDIAAWHAEASPRHRAIEDGIIEAMLRAVEHHGFHRITPSIGSTIDPTGGFIGFFLPGAAIAIWSAPSIDFHKPGVVLWSNTYVQFGVHRVELSRDQLEAIASGVDGPMRVQDCSVVDTSAFLLDAEPMYQLWLDQFTQLSIEDWASGVARACGRLLALLHNSDPRAEPFVAEIPAPEVALPPLAGRLEILDISRICEDRSWPEAAEAGLKALLGTGGSARTIVAHEPGRSTRMWHLRHGQIERTDRVGWNLVAEEPVRPDPGRTASTGEDSATESGTPSPEHVTEFPLPLLKRTS